MQALTVLLIINNNNTTRQFFKHCSCNSAEWHRGSGSSRRWRLRRISEEGSRTTAADTDTVWCGMVRPA